MAASILQETFAENTAGATSLAKAFASNITVGSTIHAIGVAYSDSATNTFSDGHNTYTSNLDHQTDGSNGMAQGYALNATGVATTVTYTVSPSQGLGLLIREVGGCSTTAIDAHIGTFVAGGSQPSVNLTLVAAGALISAVCAELNAGTAVVAGSGYTPGQSNVWLDGNGTKSGTSESQHFATSGSKAVTFTDGSAGGMLVAMSFADAAGGAVPYQYSDDEQIFFSGDDDANDEAVYVADSVPVGPNQPPLPVEDAWDREEPDDFTDDWDVLEWNSQIVVANQPPLPQPDVWPWDEPDDIWDEWEIGYDSAPVGANFVPPIAQCPEDGWNWTEPDDYWDEWELGQDSAPVGFAQPPLPAGDVWRWEEPDDLWDEWELGDDSAPVGPNQPPLVVADGWDWSEPDDFTDEWDYSARDSSPVGPNFVPPAGSQFFDDPWDWDTDGEWEEPIDANSAPVGLPPTLRVQAVVPGWYQEIFRDIGDVFDIASQDLSDASVSFVPPGNPNYPLYGWMKVVLPSTPLYSYALTQEGQSSIIAGTYTITQGVIKGLKTPRTVI